MLQMDTRVQKIQLIKELDMNFGNLRPDAVEGFTVSITTEIISLKFILLMPVIESDDLLDEMISDIMFIFFGKKINYELDDLDDGTVDRFVTFGDTPILSFHPLTLISDKISFFWLIPPRYLMQ